MKKIAILVIVLALFHFVDSERPDALSGNDAQIFEQPRSGPSSIPVTGSAPPVQNASSSDRVITQAFEQRLNSVQVQGRGRITRILADDNDGSAHQRFIIGLDSGHTLLIAHNIDLAPRVAGIKEGDVVEFFGEYEWNNQGGVMHWTHHDPQGRHVAGWLRHAGKIYQ